MTTQCVTQEDFALLSKVADWYESGPKYPVEFEEGRQRIAKALRAALAALGQPPKPDSRHEEK